MSPTRLLVALGLGSNLAPIDEPPFRAPEIPDPRRRSLEGAVTLLREAGLCIVRASRAYDSEPVGVPGPQPAYLNACVLAFTPASCVSDAATLEALLRTLEAIEARAGVRRKGSAAARALDIDILAGWHAGAGHGRRPLPLPPICVAGVLDVPHRRLARRAFVLAPLCEIAATLEIAAPAPARSVAHLLGMLGENAQRGLLAAPASHCFPYRDEALGSMDTPPGACYPAPGAQQE